MQQRTILSLGAFAIATLSVAQPARTFWSKTTSVFSPPAENMILQIKDLSNGTFGVRGNASNGTAKQPFSATFNRYGTPSGTSAIAFNDVFISSFMDYTDDSCMTYMRTMPNGNAGIGVGRTRPNGSVVYNTAIEVYPIAGPETIYESGVDATGAIYILGEGKSSNTGNSMFLQKFFPNGQRSWVRSWFKAKPLGLQVTPDGHCIVQNQNKLGNFEIQMMRINTNGATVNTESLSNGPANPLVDAFRTSHSRESNFVFHNITWAVGMDQRTEAQLIDTSTGEIVWADEVSDPNFRTLPPNGASSQNQGLYSTLVRQHTSLLQFEIQMIKHDMSGNVVWSRTIPIFPGPIMPRVSQVVVDAYGEIYLLAFADNGRTRLIKYAPNGTKRYEHILMTPQYQAVQTMSLVQMTDILISSYSFGATQTGSFLLASVQQAATALNDNYNVNKNVPNTPSRSLLQNDRYAVGATITVTQPPANGTVQVYSNGIFRYTPNQGYTGPDSFRYQLSKPTLTPSVAQVGLNVR